MGQEEELQQQQVVSSLSLNGSPKQSNKTSGVIETWEEMLMLNAVPKVVTGKVIADQVQFPVWLTERMGAAYSELTAECDIFKSQVEQQTLTRTLATETTSSNSGFLKKTWIMSQIFQLLLEASVALSFLWTIKDWMLVPKRQTFAVISSHCFYGVLMIWWIQILFSLSLYL